MKKSEGLYLPDGTFQSKEQIMAKLASDYGLSVEKPSPLKPISFEQHFNRIEQMQEIRKETSLWKDEVDIKIDTGRMPYFFTRPLSDIHFGAMGTDMEAVRQNIGDIKGLPLVTALLGDLGDFFAPLKHPEGMMGDVITPTDKE